MGEKSKVIGDIGEDIVGSFFKLIGWNDPLSNQKLNCQKPKNHAKPDSKKQHRETHGIDYLYS
jgi:hypothetical protein